jgi:AcrR family transcriptional regulator
MNERRETADRIVRAAASMLAEGGRDAVSTRTVAQAAGVQTPTIYRLFGDMDGMFDAVASYGFAQYLSTTPIPDGPIDALTELRSGWDMHIEFGLANPDIYKLMYGAPTPGKQAQFIQDTYTVLRQRVENVARDGLLRVTIDEGAQLFYAAAIGVVMTLIGVFPDERDPTLSPVVREAIVAAMVVPGAPGAGRVGDPVMESAITLASHLDSLDAVFSPGERAILAELLDRIGGSKRG